MNDLHAEFMLAEELIQAGLIQEIDSDRLKQRAPDGAVLISCGDRDRFRQHFDGCSGIVSVHPLCLNGGGILLAPGVCPTRQQVLVEDCAESMHIKGMRFVFSLSHFPCGKCSKFAFGFRDTALKTLAGKVHLKESIPRGQLDGVLPLISIDWRSAHIKQEHGVKLYAMRLQDAAAIASFGRLKDGHAPMGHSVEHGHITHHPLMNLQS
ncbi:MAG: hypothetical protein KBD65_03865 [Candidatus Moranbacteria bacterium]|nr:hypothetical protein [Candidatus Moranbacteria bacterium]